MKRVIFLGVPMHCINMNDTVEWIDRRIHAHQFTQHVVINVAKLISMRKNKKLYQAVEACDIINIDGMGVVFGARMLGIDVPEKVSGIDLFHELLLLASRKGYPIFLLGGKQVIIEKTVSTLKKQYHDLKISGYHNGYFWNNEEDVVEIIRKANAKLLFVAISSPKKEIFINRWGKTLGVDFVMGVGGTFDIIANKYKRAPKYLQLAGLEWLFRLMQDPKRLWKRYLLTNSIFLILLIIEVAKKAINWSESHI